MSKIDEIMRLSKVKTEDEWDKLLDVMNLPKRYSSRVQGYLSDFRARTIHATAKEIFRELENMELFFWFDLFRKEWNSLNTSRKYNDLKKEYLGEKK